MSRFPLQHFRVTKDSSSTAVHVRPRSSEYHTKARTQPSRLLKVPTATMRRPSEASALIRSPSSLANPGPVTAVQFSPSSEIQIAASQNPHMMPVAHSPACNTRCMSVRPPATYPATSPQPGPSGQSSTARIASIVWISPLAKEIAPRKIERPG